MNSYNSTIKPKLKPCKDCKKDSYIFSKGRCMKCHRIEYALNKQKPPSKELSSKKRYIIPKVSKKMAKELEKYRKVRDSYLKQHMICEVDDCSNLSTNNHHKKGRIGKLLTDDRYFMACCSSCHPRRIHETEVEWAKEKGYLLTRN